MPAHIDTAAFLDCHTCGKTEPARTPVLAPAGDERRWARCNCGAVGPVREVERRWHEEVDPATQECNSLCLTGKVFCECRCGGLCHGRGIGGCLCRARPAWTPPNRGGPAGAQATLFPTAAPTRKEK